MSAAYCSVRFLARACLITACAAHSAFAVDGVAAGLGVGFRDTDAEVSQIGLRWNWRTTLGGDSRGDNVPYWEADLAHVRAREGGKDASLNMVGLTVILRHAVGARVYIEAGLGVRLLSQTHLATKDLSTSFQFSPTLGAGLRFGARRQWEVGYRLLHVSNANIRTPNPGMNFNVLRLGYRF